MKLNAAAETTALQFVAITIADEDRRDGDSSRRKKGAQAPVGRIELEIGGSRLVLTAFVEPALAVVQPIKRRPPHRPAKRNSPALAHIPT
ncbi:hypothetical protein, partial [Mesorhizobium sp.]|uniref:hypothetical protein n=1 Tax=Mesorhizobium sp. TaxID=1871066 RepID=UPI0025C29A24